MSPTKKKNIKSDGSRCKAAANSVGVYIAGVPDPARGVVEKLRATIRSVVPKDATEVISYRIPAFKTKRILVWYAAFSDHCSLFPGATMVERFKNELKTFRTSKGTIHFPLDKPLPTALIKKIVHARIRAAES